MIRSALKYFIYRYIGKPIYGVLKGFYLPSRYMRRRLRFIGKFRVSTQDGRKFFLYNNAFHLENNIYWLGIDQYPWERMTRRIWIKLSRCSKTIFDVGANSGIFAVLAKVYNPGSSVYAFEPQPNVYEVLVKNSQINEFGIRCEKYALSDCEGAFPFYNFGPDTFTSENTTAGSLNQEWINKEDRSSIIVDVLRLDTYIRNNQIEGIDLLKIDVETLEYEVILGYGASLYRHLPVIILEVQNRKIGKRIESLFDKNIYSFFHIYEQSGLMSVSELGNSSSNLNYLLCPNSKLDLIREFIISE
jgi:FkbM family methyltransferase